MVEGRLNKIIVFLIYVSIFINSLVLFTSPFEFYIGYIIYFLLLPVFLLRYKIPQSILLLFLFLLIYGIVQIYFGNNTPGQFFKIYLGVTLSYFFYYLVVVEFKYDVEKLFKLYLLGCYWVCIIAIVQYISFKFNFSPGYDYSWLLNKWGVIVEGGKIRLNSIFGEPSYFAIFISSAVFVAMHDLIFFRNPFYFNKTQAFIVLIASFLSSSSAGYIGYFFGLIVFLLNFGLIRYVLIMIPLTLIIFYQLYNNVPEFKDRYDGTVAIFQTGQFQIGKTNGSSIILYNNFHIAVENFKENFLGTGLGSHPVAFEKYSITKDVNIHGFDLNKQDANSMFNRLLSETGILGIVIFFLLITKCFVKKPDVIHDKNRDYWIISGAILVMILVNLARQGHYFLNGFPFFVWLYYFNKQNSLNQTEVSVG